MSNSQCAMQRRAIAELMCQGGVIPFVDFDQADYAFAALADEGSESIAMIAANLECVAEDVRKLRTVSIRNRLEYAHQQTITNLKLLRESIDELDDALPEHTWPDDLKASLRAMLEAVDCTTAAGQAEMRGMVRALAEFGLVSQPDSSIGKVA